MLTALLVLVRSMGLICRGHREVALENLAHRLDDRAARHRGAVAPPMAPASVEVALRTYTSGAVQHGCGDPNARRHDGRRESALGSAADSRRIVQAGPHRIRAHGVAAPA